MRFVHILTGLTVLCLLGGIHPPVARAIEKEAASYDVVVIGGTPAGVAAAIAAARAGKTVMLVEQAPVLGGLLSSGVSRADDLIAEANSGVFEEFRQRVGAYHRSELANDPVVKTHLATAPIRWNAAEGQAWEPRTAARIYAEMVAEVPTISIRFEEVPVDAEVKDERVVAVVTQDKAKRKHRYEGRIIIDATYEADVAAFAGVPFRIGREARTREEPHAGHIYTDAFCARDRSILQGTILPGGTGEGDDRTQAFVFRFVVKDYGQANHPYRLETPPPGYDPTLYRWNRHERSILPNNKRDMLGITWGNDLAWDGRLPTRYILAGWEERAEIEEVFRNHALGWLYYIQTDGGSPQWGLPDDEFTDNDHFPYRLYVRQGRRIEGLYTLTESDLHKDLLGNGLRGPLHRDSIAIGVYPMDVHHVQDPTNRSSPCYGEGSGEGTLHLDDVTGPYQIPYGVMVPVNRKGLLVPVGISCTHVAMSSVRMEPVWSSLGQAAGVASALAIESDRELEDVPVKEIQDVLLQQRSTLFFYKDLPGDAVAFRAVQKLSLLGAVDGDDNYHFRPNQPIKMGDFARMVVEGLDVPISITAQHFKDVPRGHPAFKYIESLYDYSTQSATPFFPYEVRDYFQYWTQDSLVFAYPDHAVTFETATKIVSQLRDIIGFVHPEHPMGGIDVKWDSKLLEETVGGPKNPEHILTRSEAARMIYRLREGMR